MFFLGCLTFGLLPEAILYPFQKFEVELSNILLFTECDRLIEIVDECLKDAAGLGVALVGHDEGREELGELEDQGYARGLSTLPTVGGVWSQGERVLLPQNPLCEVRDVEVALNQRIEIASYIIILIKKDE